MSRVALLSAKPAPVPLVTWNPADEFQVTLSNSNLTASRVNAGGADIGAVRAISSKSTGKWYFRVRYVTQPGTNAWCAGLFDSVATLGDYVGHTTHGISVAVNLLGTNSALLTNGGVISGGGTIPTLSPNDYVVIAFDADAKLMWANTMISGVLGSWTLSGTGDPATGTGGADISTLTPPYFPAWSAGNPGGGDAGTYTAIIDAQTAIVDASLAGFSRMT